MPRPRFWRKPKKSLPKEAEHFKIFGHSVFDAIVEQDCDGDYVILHIEYDYADLPDSISVFCLTETFYVDGVRISEDAPKMKERLQLILRAVPMDKKNQQIIRKFIRNYLPV